MPRSKLWLIPFIQGPEFIIIVEVCVDAYFIFFVSMPHPEVVGINVKGATLDLKPLPKGKNAGDVMVVEWNCH